MTTQEIMIHALKRRIHKLMAENAQLRAEVTRLEGAAQRAEVALAVSSPPGEVVLIDSESDAPRAKGRRKSQPAEMVG